ncbi:cadherin-17 [Sorex fumeus]|uniref:cadherin-17 n=1 Tax=Sorex fumeus TaxID=62283 RepID=UPI0024AD8FC4|nr:cadherin-17 [Sorex fumeus]
MFPAPLHCLCLLTLFLTIAYARFSGPLEPMTFTVYEGQESSQVIFQFKAGPSAVDFRVTGDTDGIFQIQPDGLLYSNKTLDRETRPLHVLQVSALNAQGVTVEGPVTITIEVKDINDNKPQFVPKKYEVSVRQNSRPGKPFLYVNATDLDDPATPNGQLSYKIMLQLPKFNDIMYFQIDSKTGGISLTPEGSKDLDPTKNSFYQLVVIVKDMGDQEENSFSDDADVDITVLGNIWKAPEPVTIIENSTDPHPMKITQVRWNDPGAVYSLVEKEKLPRLPFSIDQNGDIYVTEPLDREEKDSYVFYAVAKDDQGLHLARPLEVKVKVEDINDNPPSCPPTITVFEVQENEKIGSSIGKFTAQDMDEANSINSVLKYKIVDQTPKHPREDLFLIQDYSGVLQLARQSLKKQDSPQYNLTISVSDKDFTTICHVQVNVIDINDQIPIFEKADYGNLTLPEDTPIGTTILTIQATDSDEPLTGSWRIVYRIIAGDDEGQLDVETDLLTNAGSVIVKKPLDFETTPVHDIVFKAENPEPLVSGVDYNDSSFATFQLFVTNVNEAPQFSQHVFQASVSEDVPIGTQVGNVTAQDPEGLNISYSLRNNKDGWLRIDPFTGDIFTAAKLDREDQDPYRVQVVATETGGSTLSTAVEFHLNIQDVNDNGPRLVKDYNGLFLCHPLTAPGSVVFQATDDDVQPYRGSQFTFSLGSDSLKNSWEVTKINGTYASVSTKHTNFEEEVYNISIRIIDNGKPPMESTVYLPITFCKCEAGSCYRPAGQQPGMPTVGMAVGILLVTFLVIGIILAVVFIRIKKDKNQENENTDASEIKPLRR